MDYNNMPPNTGGINGLKSEEKDRKRQMQRFTVKEAKTKSKFAQIFLSGDANAVKKYLIEDAMPSLKEWIFTNGIRAVETVVFGEPRYGGNNNRKGAKVQFYDYTNSNGNGSSNRDNRSSYVRYDFNDIVFNTRRDALDCLKSMQDIIGEYGTVTVGDLIDLVGRVPTKADWNHGWLDLRTAGTRDVIGGCILDLPEPRPLNK